ncbi:hypothetical protein HMPREF0083_00563 [Aneurinibacillus aneurinilyticus ATCC 12856]|uniref:Uncharacterized protein n=1 Tax=Aneurinibacillus aneurinilyticus ATCC 12856 TaxID=649747 RepID=U1X8R9_ANEAE|nr:hypothetical protein HMPREF0083_00563 [Aneurinibacillus aneurinilyticus ATCC 12856]
MVAKRDIYFSFIYRKTKQREKDRDDPIPNCIPFVSFIQKTGGNSKWLNIQEQQSK